MSSILKALQKLERDTAGGRPRHDPQASLRELVPQKMAGRSRGLAIRHAAFALFAAVFLGAVSYALWRYPLSAPRSTMETGPSTAETAAPAPAAEVQRHAVAPPADTLKPATPEPADAPASPPGLQAAAPQGTAGPPPLPQPQPAATRPPAPEVRQASQPATAPGKDAKPKAVPPSRPAEKPGAVESAPPPLLRTQPAAPPVPAAAPDPAPPEKPSARPAPAPRQLPASPSAEDPDALPLKSQDETGLAIQALVWSEVPEDRLVVVNGSILKEGGGIDGATVAAIGEDYIVVRKGAERWRVKFQLK